MSDISCCPRIWLRIRSEGVHRVERWPLGGAGGEASLSKCWDYLVDHTKELEVSAECACAAVNSVVSFVFRCSICAVNEVLFYFRKILKILKSLKMSITSLETSSARWICPPWRPSSTSTARSSSTPSVLDRTGKTSTDCEKGR